MNQFSDLARIGPIPLTQPCGVAGGRCFAMLSLMQRAAIRKISETIADFGTPLLEELGPGASPETVRAAFEFAILVWNAHVCAMPRWGQPRELAHLQRRLQSTAANAAQVEAFRLLSQRRADHFATDARAVGEWSVETRDGRWQLKCDARTPVEA